jgi:hypothetical protein
MLSNKVLILCTVFLLLTGAVNLSAQEVTTFSFASDDHHAGSTFQMNGNFSFIGDGEVFLLVDKNDDTYGGLVKYQCKFYYYCVLSDYYQYNYNGGYIHVWTARGIVRFHHIDSTTGYPPVLTIEFSKALVSSWSANSDSIGDTMTIQDGERIDPNITFQPYPMLIGIGVDPSGLVERESFAFTLTDIKGNISINPDTGAFLGEWYSEGSFSASASAN